MLILLAVLILGGVPLWGLIVAIGVHRYLDRPKRR